MLGGNGGKRCLLLHVSALQLSSYHRDGNFRRSNKCRTRFLFWRCSKVSKGPSRGACLAVWAVFPQLTVGSWPLTDLELLSLEKNTYSAQISRSSQPVPVTIPGGAGLCSQAAVLYKFSSVSCPVCLAMVWSGALDACKCGIFHLLELWLDQIGFLLFWGSQEGSKTRGS